MPLNLEEIDRIVDKLQGNNLGPNDPMIYSLVHFMLKSHEQKSRERDYGTVEIKIVYKNGVIDTASETNQTSLKNNLKA